MRRIFLVVVCLIVYGSLYPWQFHQIQSGTGALLSLLLHSWPASLNRFVIRDTVVNVVLYAPLGLFGYLGWVQDLRKSTATAAVLAVALCLSTCIEIIQLFEPSRYSSVFDIVCNLTGAVIGVVIARVYSKPLAPLVSWSAQEALLHLSAGAILLLCWASYQTIPLFPQLSTTQLIIKIKSLFSPPSWSPIEMIASVVDWLTVAALVGELLEQARSRLLTTGLMLLLPGRLLLDTRSVTAAECLGAGIAWTVWDRLLSRRPKRFLLLACLSVATLVLRGLAPFHFTAAHQFSWIPFAASLSYEQAAAFVVFFRKCFLYGAAVWLLWRAGAQRVMAAFSVAALLAVIEAAQIRLPGRTPEITDPLLALIMAAIMYFAGRRKRTVDAADSRPASVS